ncbi:MAG: hypothetical protein ACTSW1_14155 [Candidatus Hodarchaeales archaeon]
MKHPEWEQFNKEREKQGKKPVSFEDWFRNYKDRRVQECIKYLGLDIQAPNYGTRNKQELMKQVISLTAKWDRGSYDKWVNLLSIRLGLQHRKVKQNYLQPLIGVGILLRHGNYVVFNGLPMDAYQDA